MPCPRRSALVAALALACLTVVVAGSRAGEPDLGLDLVVSGLSQPLFVTAPSEDFERLFVVEQGGTIRIVRDGAVVPQPFLDITGRVLSGGERGLLGMAFHPDYVTNGFFYVDYTDLAGDTVVSRFSVGANPDLADSTSEVPVLAVDQPTDIHNGGMLAFGPRDGYLYVGLGDGGPGNDANGNAQNGQSLLGKILRIDVNGGAPYAVPPDNPFVGNPAIRDEVWALGLRNPWRFSFDRVTGDLYIGDVAESGSEEIDVTRHGVSGRNYGWRCVEGRTCTGLSGCSCGSAALTGPVHVYSHGPDRCAVTGGYVYRGCDLQELDGTYFYADFCGAIESFRYEGVDDPPVTDRTAELEPPGPAFLLLIPSFGEDAAGELYLVDSVDGELYKLVRRPPGVTVEITSSVVTVSPGDPIPFEVTLANPTGQSQAFAGWLDVIKPNRNPYPQNPVLGPIQKSIGPGGRVTKSRQISIPPSFPPSGPYFLRVVAGTFPGGIESSACVAFVVE